MAIGWTVKSIEFRTKRSDLIDPEAGFHKRWLEYTAQFGDAADIVVVVEADQPETVTAAINDLGSRMDRDSEFFRSVLYKIDAPNRIDIKRYRLCSVMAGQLVVDVLSDVCTVVASVRNKDFRHRFETKSLRLATVARVES